MFNGGAHGPGATGGIRLADRPGYLSEAVRHGAALPGDIGSLHDGVPRGRVKGRRGPTRGAGRDGGSTRSGAYLLLVGTPLSCQRTTRSRMIRRSRAFGC